MATIAPEQIKRIHTLLSGIGKANDKEYKMHLVSTYSHKRATSTKDLTHQEAEQMIRGLQGLAPYGHKAGDKQRKLILHYAHQMKWELPDGRVDVQRVDDWCKKFGKYHKGLNAHTPEELPGLVTQFEAVYKSYLKGILG